MYEPRGRHAHLDGPFEDVFAARISGTVLSRGLSFLEWLALRTITEAVRDADAFARDGTGRVGYTPRHAREELLAWINGAPAPMTLAFGCELLDLDCWSVQTALRKRLAGLMPPAPRMVRRD